jgi:hemerythrin-like domain-containing protein
MKRNENLIELSRDHHHGLLLGWKIKTGLRRKVPVDQIADYIVHFAREALFPHFEEEENKVLGYLEKADPFYQRTIQEHSEIRQLIKQLCIKNLTDASLLTNFADKLDAHIRFEERELFPYMENVLSMQQLEQIGKEIAELHQPYIEKYSDEFWAN